jgi:hypothetical protein
VALGREEVIIMGQKPKVDWTKEADAKRGFRYCAKVKGEVQIMACMFCPYGHMTCCHFPCSEHSKEYCGHSYE